VSMSYHYIIIGAGSSGCVVAARLSEHPENKVLLLEAGGRDTSLLLKMPLAFTTLRGHPTLEWGYDTDPEPFANGRNVPAARGKVLGGSSSVNGMMYSRGHPRDYDQWRQMGAEGWSHEEVLPYFKKSERNWRGESAVHGGAGPLSVVPYVSREPISAAIRKTAKGLGYRVLDDFEAGDPEGFALPDSSIQRGRRASASKAFLEPARGRPNLTVVTNAHVSRIVVDKGRATGVEYLKDGRLVSAQAGETVLCGGAYATPQLLMLSGIGPADHLRELGVPVVLDLPGVGSGLQEHPLVPMAFSLKKPLDFGRRMRADRLALSGLYWLLTGRGTPSNVPLSCIAYYKSRPDLERPDLENIFMGTNMAANVWFPGWRKPAPDQLTSLNVVLRPGSRGSVRLRSADPLDKPRIQFNLLQDPEDLRLLRHALRWTRDFVRQGELAEHVGQEAFPGAALDTDAGLDAYIRQVVGTAQHPACSCKMGDGPDAVVDAQLRVRGVEGLRIADASVMPTLIGGHTNAPCIMIGEKAADMILAS
jgi:choline dehydrogenase